MIPQLDKRAGGGYHDHHDDDDDYLHQPGKPMTRAQQIRKIKKPILEKKRRDRINRSLDDLKDLMMKVYNKDVSDHKLEKADILELTVQYLHMVNSGALGIGTAGGAGTTPAADLYCHYRTGYEHCLQEVSRYLHQPHPASPQPQPHQHEQLQQRLLQHCQEQLRLSSPPALVPSMTSPSLPPELLSPASLLAAAAGSMYPVVPPLAATAPPPAAHNSAPPRIDSDASSSGSKQLSSPAGCSTNLGPSNCASSLRSSCSPAGSELSAGSEPMWRPW